MVDFVVLSVKGKELFEKRIREYMEKGYRVKNANMTIAYKPRQKIDWEEEIIEGYFAYMEKE